MQDFLQNRPRVAAAGSTRPPGAGAAAQPAPHFDAALLGALHAGSSDGHDATVEVIKEGDRVTKLLVTCRCGEKIEILCAYAPGQR